MDSPMTINNVNTIALMFLQVQYKTLACTDTPRIIRDTRTMVLAFRKFGTTAADSPMTINNMNTITLVKIHEF